MKLSTICWKLSPSTSSQSHWGQFKPDSLHQLFTMYALFEIECHVLQHVVTLRHCRRILSRILSWTRYTSSARATRYLAGRVLLTKLLQTRLKRRQPTPHLTLHLALHLTIQNLNKDTPLPCCCSLLLVWLSAEVFVLSSFCTCSDGHRCKLVIWVVLLSADCEGWGIFTCSI